MIKSIVVAHKKAGMSTEEFNRYWKEVHGPIAAGAPGVRKYVQNHFLKIPGRQFEGDGIVEMWYDDLQGFENFMYFLGTPEGKFLAEDGAKFADMSHSQLWLVEEHIVKDETGS
ncbi:MAG: EthD family reductase [Dehalococcoidales bacterium]|nr:EthD family reductase [Dehalococcoidales bacterium]